MVALNALLSLVSVLAYASAAPRLSQRGELIFADIHSFAGGDAAPGLNTGRQFNPRGSYLGGLRPVGRGLATEKESHRARRRRFPQGLPAPFAPSNTVTSQTDETGTTAPLPQATLDPDTAPDPAPDPTPASDPASIPVPPPASEPDTISAPDGTSATPTDPAAPVSTTIDSQPRNGQGTLYATGKGACGWNNTDTDMIAALSHSLYDLFTVGTDNNDNSLCGKSITAHAGASSVNVTVADRCEACQFNDLDFSPAAFGGLADMTAGRIDITWEFNDP